MDVRERPTSAASMLARPVTAEGDHIGEVTGVFADSGCERIFGLEVTSPEGGSKFLPWVAAHVAGGTVTADSALVLIDLAELDGYTHRGAQVYRDRGVLQSVLIGRDGSVECISALVSAVLAAGTPMT